eukprot:Rhum_TRINITY_DN15317_c0_g1::Rhum_TRINITY_DN15317_c0_g1_i1::g.151587::m.151587
MFSSRLHSFHTKCVYGVSPDTCTSDARRNRQCEHSENVLLSVSSLLPFDAVRYLPLCVIAYVCVVEHSPSVLCDPHPCTSSQICPIVVTAENDTGAGGGGVATADVHSYWYRMWFPLHPDRVTVIALRKSLPQSRLCRSRYCTCFPSSSLHPVCFVYTLFPLSSFVQWYLYRMSFPLHACTTKSVSAYPAEHRSCWRSRYCIRFPRSSWQFVYFVSTCDATPVPRPVPHVPAVGAPEPQQQVPHRPPGPAALRQLPVQVLCVHVPRVLAVVEVVLPDLLRTLAVPHQACQQRCGKSRRMCFISNVWLEVAM